MYQIKYILITYSFQEHILLYSSCTSKLLLAHYHTALLVMIMYLMLNSILLKSKIYKIVKIINFFSIHTQILHIFKKGFILEKI